MTTEKPSFLIRYIWIIAAIIGVASLTIMRTCEPRGLNQIMPLGKAPTFNLTAQDGSAFDSRTLAGEVWVASFIFTSCRTECPVIGKANQDLLDALADTRARLVSITVDPEFDTPEVLTTWGRTYGATPESWKLLTGPRSEITRVVTEFAAHMGKREVDGGLVTIAHSQYLYLVDPAGDFYKFDLRSPDQLKYLPDYVRYFEAEQRKQQGGPK
jgi:cytochrome oxidase Cu insertion factor (SCO1/SenC/PrrC family)